MLDTIQKEGKSEDYIKFLHASLEYDLEDENGGYSIAPITKEDLEIKFKEIETKAGINLGEKVKNAFIAAGMAENPPARGLSPISGSSTAFENPFIDLNFAQTIDLAGSKEKVLANQKKITKALDRAENIFDKSQEKIISYLKKKISERPDRKDEFKLMIKRIETISFNKNVNQSATCSGPNAFYDPGTHQFTLCQQILEFPKASLEAILLHELGHSIDPCLVSQDLMTISDIKEKDNNFSYVPIGTGPSGSGNIIDLPENPVKHTHSVDYMGKIKENLSNVYEDFKLEKVFVTQPALKKALGCKEEAGGKYCE